MCLCEIARYTRQFSRPASFHDQPFCWYSLQRSYLSKQLCCCQYEKCVSACNTNSSSNSSPSFSLIAHQILPDICLPFLKRRQVFRVPKTVLRGRKKLFSIVKWWTMPYTMEVIVPEMLIVTHFSFYSCIPFSLSCPPAEQTMMNDTVSMVQSFHFQFTSSSLWSHWLSGFIWLWSSLTNSWGSLVGPSGFLCLLHIHHWFLSGQIILPKGL